MSLYPWQLDLWAPLDQRIQSGKLPHAMLFSGTDGIGKLNLALFFVQHLFCNAKQNGSPCGECQPCHLLSINNHPDQYRISALDGKKNISVDQIRRLIAYVNLKPHSAQKKVAIIENAELMNVNAANSVLKTLEEPPESCLLILLTSRPEQLIATIRSRCQMINFTKPDNKYSLPWLTSKVTKTEDAEKLLALSVGAPLKALEYEEQGLLAQRSNMFSSLQGLLKGSENPVLVAGVWFKMNIDITYLCMISWVVDMIRLNVDETPPVINNPDLKEPLLDMARKISLSHLLSFNVFISDIPRLRKSNINEQLLLEEMLIRWSALNKSTI